MNKGLRFVIIFILSICIFFPGKTAFTKDIKATSPGDNPKNSELNLNFHELAEYRAERGIRNMEPYSIILTEKGLKAYNEHKEEEAIKFFREAIELSPDLPSPYLYLARANFSLYPKKLYIASDYLQDALKAFYGNFWWSFQTAGIFFITLFLAFHVSMLVFFIILAASKSRLYIHDIIEDRRKIFLLLPSVILVFFGPIFGVIGLILPFWLYMKRKEKIMIYCAIGLLAVMVMIFPLLSLFLSASQDKTLRGIVKMNEGIYTAELQEVGSNGNSYESIFTLALELKKRGNYNEAIKMYKELLVQGSDARIYNNLANCYVGLGDYNTALEYYKKALKLKKMSSTYYNLSQLHREFLNFDDAEKYYRDAIKIDPQKVTYYNSVRGTSVNSMVMDEPLSENELRRVAFKRYPAYESLMHSGKMLSFTSRGFSFFLLLLLSLTLYIFNRYFSYGAYRCKRCGVINCSKCENRISHEDVCVTCFKTLVKVSELSPKDRIKRILDIQRHMDNMNRRLKILTLICPGSGHIYFGKSAFGSMILLLFVFFVFSILLWFYIPTPVSMDQVASFFRWTSFAGLILVYGVAVMNVFRRIPGKWL